MGDGTWQRAAVIGAGTIGLSWATLFAARGLQVRVTDPRPDLEDAVERAVRQFSQTLPDGSADPDELLGRIAVDADLPGAVAEADVVQENGPEDLGFKQDLFVRVERAAPRRALLLSSTSGQMPSRMSSGMDEPGRVVVGHPFNPAHLIPLVEVVPGVETDASLTGAAVAFYRWLGKEPVVLHREVGGFVANRLQSAILREGVDLVQRGVVTTEALDEIMTASLGIRWAMSGPFEAMHLGGGPGGLRHQLEHFGPAMSKQWVRTGGPELTPELIARLADETEDRFRDLTYEELSARRDRQVLAVLAARRRAAAEDQPVDGGGAGS